MKGLNNEVYLSVHWFVQRTLKVDGAARQKMWQIEIEMNAQQEKADLVGISYVDCLFNNTRHMSYAFCTAEKRYH